MNGSIQSCLFFYGTASFNSAERFFTLSYTRLMPWQCGCCVLHSFACLYVCASVGVLPRHENKVGVICHRTKMQKAAQVKGTTTKSRVNETIDETCWH